MERDDETALLLEMKRDEQDLILLYERGDICSEEWTKEFLALTKKFQNYTYQGEFTEIYDFLKEVKGYGEKLEVVGNFFLEGKLEEGLKGLERLEELASEIQGGT